MKRILLACLCIGLMGCTATISPYIATYNQAVSSGNSIVVTKEGDFETAKAEVERQLGSIGYTKIVYSNPDEGFSVFARDTDYANAMIVSGKHTYKIILKYTKIVAGKTRIDLVNASTEAFTRDDIDKDIQRLVGLIQNRD